MIRTEVILGVKDVEKSAQWYQSLLNCNSSHGGNTFEILIDEDGTVILCLHKWGNHDHPTLRGPQLPAGNGLILYFKVNNLDDVWKNAQNMNALIEERPHINPNSHLEEFSLRDPDGYYIAISSIK